MNKIISEIMQKRIDYLKENEPEQYQKMYEEGTLLDHAEKIEEEYRDYIEEYCNRLKKEYRTKGGRTFTQLIRAEKLAKEVDFEYEAKQKAEIEIIKKPL